MDEVEPPGLQPAIDRTRRKSERDELAACDDATAPRSEPGDGTVDLPPDLEGGSTLTTVFVVDVQVA